ncbi:response regulator [Geoalkalibacter halelectricus]|uniref:Response regulator n=2 Tax=Geoalkalibacter halelectricus TaxID=2847045 RepID=A0ABY5ZQZ7_9BACT|nr:response regulator [Geoalkalibacter halelectricus]UWZ81600.1 response regulator [Geoalkalibacter halelectricus]
MGVLLIADRDKDGRKQLADFFANAGYQVVETDSAAQVLLDTFKKEAQVVLLSGEFDEIPAADLIPIIKKCNRHLTIILVSNEESLPQIRKLRSEGIFYHALKPVNAADKEELKLAVQCAFANAGGAPRHT